MSDEVGSTALKPRVGVDAAGNLLAVWIVTPQQEVRSSSRPTGSSSWTASQLVDDFTGYPDDLHLAVGTNGRGAAAWTAGGPYSPIKSADYDPSTTLWSSATQVSDGPIPFTNSVTPAVAIRDSQLMVAWADDQRDGGDIQARRRVTSGGVDHFAYAYDGLNRLRSVAGPVAESFTLDAGSNIASRTGPSATNTYDTSNRLTSDGTRTFTWSGTDRLTQRGSDTFSYDALGRLTSSTVGGVSRTYAYNGDGLIASRTEGAATTTFLWDVSVSPATLIQAGSDRVVHGLGPLYGVRADASTYTFGRDGLGSVRAEVTSFGSVSKSFRYAAYGAIAQSTGGAPTLFGFAGDMADPSGLIYLRARWYDPSAARFTSRDSFGGFTYAPASLNAYAYVGGRPTSLVDPLGLDPSQSSFGRNAAFTIAGIFADLDSPDLLRQTSAYVIVIASGFALWGLLVAAGPIAAAATPPAAPLVKKVAVIGENQTRVLKTASELGAATMPRVEGGHLTRLAANRAWIQELMDEGYQVVNVGRDLERIRQGAPISPFFQAELEEIFQAGYSNVVPGPWPVVP